MRSEVCSKRPYRVGGFEEAKVKVEPRFGECPRPCGRFRTSRWLWKVICEVRVDVCC
jgi:hypothetical protein